MLKVFTECFCSILIVSFLVGCKASEKSEYTEFEFLQPNRTYTERVLNNNLNTDNGKRIQSIYINQNQELIRIDYDYPLEQLVSETWFFSSLEYSDSAYVKEYIEKKNSTIGNYVTIQIFGFDSKFDYKNKSTHNFILKNKTGSVLFECFMTLESNKKYSLAVTYYYLNKS